MSKAIFSIEQVAEELSLHPKTILRYVSDGRLKAAKIGKQYRILRPDLEKFLGRKLDKVPNTTISRERHTEASCVIQIDAISKQTFSRLSNTLIAAVNSRGTQENSLRVDTLYQEELGRMKIICIGQLADSAELFGLIDTFLKNTI